MQLSKKQSLKIALGILALFFIVAFSVKKFSSAIGAKGGVEITTERTGGFTLKQFERGETKNGKKVWDIKADTATFFPKENATTVHDATVKLYRENGNIVTIKSQEAELEADGSSLNNAHLTNGVTILFNDQVRIDTEKADFQKDKGIINAPTPIKVTGERTTITGNKMDGDLEKDEFVIKGNVLTVIEPQEDEK